MSNNIWGYQGLQTPLESLTNGNYNVADYTTMRKEFNARLQALENAGGFQPTNVQIQGYCSIVPGTQGPGNLTASGVTSLGSTLTVSGQVTCSAGLSVAGVLTAGSLNFTSLAAIDAGVSNLVVSNSADFNGPMTTKNITIDGGSTISGNGSGLTNINDITKLPLGGGAMTGTLTTRQIVIGAGFSIQGDGSLLSNVQATDPNALPLTGGGLSGTLSTQNIIVNNGYSITGNGSKLTTANLSSFDNILGGPAWIPAANYSKYLHLVLNYSNAVTVQLKNMGFTNSDFPDNSRTITITKKAVASGDYIMTLSLPVQSGYTWRWITPASDGGTANIQMLVGTSSFTFNLITDGVSIGYAILISSVKV